MPQIDPIILQLRADLSAYKAQLRATTTIATNALRLQERGVANLERQFTRSSAGISESLRGLAGTFAAAFSATQVVKLADGYTRFTNQLKVAGIEGGLLAKQQEALFAISQRYGVELESVGTLYSRAAQNSRELGASQGELSSFTEAVAASLKISGTSASEASGSLLQLGQALGSPRIQAEEFNSLLDTMQPLLREAAKEIDGTGGSLAGLTRLIKDTEGPGVSNVQLFQAVTASLSRLQDTASATTLTISNSFTVLNNALGKYIGETDASLSATERISAGIIGLSQNLDTVIEAVSVLSAILLGRYVAGMSAATGATGVASAAIFALQARAIGAATTLEALKFAGVAAGRSLLAAFGGPVGLAVAGLAVGIYYLSQRTDESAQAAKSYADAQRAATQVTDRAAEIADRLATAHGRARDEALSLAKAERESTKQKLASAQASLILAEAEATRAKAFAETTARNSRFVASDPRFASQGVQAGADANAARQTANVQAAERTVLSLQAALNKINKAIEAGPPEVAPTTEKKEKKPKAKKDTGPTPEEIARRFADDVRAGDLEYIQAMADLTGTAEARRTVEVSRIKAEAASRDAAIKADKDYSSAQREKLLLLNRQVETARLDAVRAEALAEYDDAQVAIAEAAIETRGQALDAEARLANTAAQKRDIELRILDLQLEEERLRLEAIANNERINEAEREIARRRLEQLPGLYSARRAGIERDNEGPLARARREYDDPETAIEQAVADKLRSIDEAIADTAAQVLGVKDPFLRTLLQIFLQQNVLKPLQDALQSAGGGNDFLSSIISSAVGAFTGGRASGGYVGAGQLVRVNEGASPGRVEGFRPVGAGTIIPLGRMNAQPSRAQQQPVVVELAVGPGQMLEPYVQKISGDVSVRTVKAAAPEIRRQAAGDAPAAVRRAQRYGTRP